MTDEEALFPGGCMDGYDQCVARVDKMAATDGPQGVAHCTSSESYHLSQMHYRIGLQALENHKTPSRPALMWLS